jgi:hypothetical protein
MHCTGRHDLMILNHKNSESVTVPESMHHLIRTYHFFDGLGARFRTDPERLASVLG